MKSRVPTGSDSASPETPVFKSAALDFASRGNSDSKSGAESSSRSYSRPHSRLSNVEAFILAGGKSSRFGSDKALAIWNGRPLLAYAIAAVKDLGLNPRVVCRDPFPYFELATAFVISEHPDLGPLEGLRVSLKSCLQDLALVLTADMPLVSKAHLQRILTSPAADRPVLFVSEDMSASGKAVIRHPFPGLYPRSVLSAIEALSPGSSLQALFDRNPPSALKADLSLEPALHSVNAPEDLRQL